MSSFIKRTKNPITKEFEDAQWIDDFFGPHRYGVMFPSYPEIIYDADKEEWEFEETPETKEKPDEL